MMSPDEGMIKHAIERFTERFKKEDFVYKSKKYGLVDFTEEVVNSIVHAPKHGKCVGGGKGYRTIFKVKVHEKTKPVFVVWDMKYSVPVTVLTGPMWFKTYG
jgi:glutamine cyclotransferase